VSDLRPDQIAEGQDWRRGVGQPSERRRYLLLKLDRDRGRATMQRTDQPLDVAETVEVGIGTLLASWVLVRDIDWRNAVQDDETP
jgi:hypothetical protein